MRLQLALNVRDLDEAIGFYSKMFGASLHKRRPGYASFAIDAPPLKLVLFEAPDAAERINHLGVEVFDDAEVAAATARLRGAGLETRVEDGTTCCYAKADKAWVTEPQGLSWEWYRVLADSATFGSAPAHVTPPAELSAKPDAGADPDRGRADAAAGCSGPRCC